MSYYHAVVEWIARTAEASERMYEEREPSGRRAPIETTCDRSDGRPEARAIE